jgi:chorismate dehydratase
MEPNSTRGSQGCAPLRLGRIDFVNVLPVYLFLEQDACLFQEVRSTPSRLNEMLRHGLLDVSPASSIEYARNPAAYRVLRDLSISSRGKVRSVLLLSRLPMEQWRGGVIQCPMESETSVALLELLLRNHWHIEATLVQEGVALDPAALLRIGDRALREAASGQWEHVLDLGQAWLEWTGLPFVFASWLVRREVVDNRPWQLRALHGALIRARERGVGDLQACERGARARLGEMDLDFLEYFRGLSFHLGEEEIRGLMRFYEELARARIVGEVPDVVLWPPGGPGNSPEPREDPDGL